MIIIMAAPYGEMVLELTSKMIERVEILKGPGSSMYGTGAMYGVVNVIIKEGKDIDGIRVGGDIGSFGRKRASLLAGESF